MKINLLSKSLLMGTALMMAACSNEEPVVDNGNNNQLPTDGSVAYMSVTIKSADKISRSTTDEGYEYGTADENAVKNVRFFFFDKDGAHMELTAYLVDQSDANVDLDRNEHKNDVADGNIEATFKNNLLVLEDMKSNEYPSYMLTIINQPQFKCGTNLTNTLALLDNYDKVISDKAYKVMSTSSYVGSDANHSDDYPFVTKLNPTDFYNTPEEATTKNKAVEVYVERLAAKVQLSVNVTADDKIVTLADGTKLYKLETTVGGGDGNDNTGETELNTALYLKVLGWALNTTANNSYMSKNIDTAWSFADWTWNNAGDHRSFWAKSIVYGLDVDAAESMVTYTPTDKITLGFTTDDVAYCNENTNKADIACKEETLPEGSTGTPRALVDSRIVTNVVLKTQICDVNGNPIDMVYANGTLFRKDAYLQYIINRAYVGTDALNLWVKTADDTTSEGNTTINKKEYEQIGLEYFTLVLPTQSEGTGDVDVIVNEDAFTGTYYTYDENGEAGKKYTEVPAEDLAAEIAKIKAKIAAVQPTGANHAVIYDNGMNIYYIPVEHLAAEKTQTNNVEGYYGVVRNHSYKLKINSFSKVGHGIWDPSRGDDYVETTKPDQPEDPLYYLGAHINILSWKVVDQDVDL